MNIINTIKSYGITTLAGFNEGAAKELILSYTNPIQNVLIWAIPSIAGIAALIAGGKYMLIDEEERDRHKFFKQLKRILIVAVVCESLTVIMKIVGITTR